LKSSLKKTTAVLLLSCLSKALHTKKPPDLEHLIIVVVSQALNFATPFTRLQESNLMVLLNAVITKVSISC
jgi:hypothetical protein